MILTQQSIRRLLSSHAIVQVLPEMLTYVEQAKAIRTNLASSGGCSTCHERSALEPTLRQALQFIAGLAPDRLAILRTFLGVRGDKLYTYVPQSNGKQGLVEIGA